MIGSIRSYLPKSKRGLLQTPAGERFSFLMDGSDDLHGGDVVEFDRAPNDRIAINVRLQRRYADLLNQEQRSAVTALHSLLHAGGRDSS